jgi:hypothetical protein
MRLSVWAWLFWTLPIYLVLEIGPFLIIGWGLKKTVGELVGPYLAFALPAVIFMPLVWWLRMSEEEGASPKRLAREWGVSVAFWGVAVAVAVIYSGVKLGFMDSKDAIGGLAVSVLLSVPTLYFTVYHMTFTRISSRSGVRTAGPPHEH